MTLCCKMMFACVVFVAAFASINAAAVHVGETTLTGGLLSNSSTVAERDDDQKTGTPPFIADNNHLSTMGKRTDMPINKKLRLTIDILNKLVEKKKNFTDSFFSLFFKLKDSGEILRAAKTFTLNNITKNDNTDFKGTTELSPAADVMSINNVIKETSAQSRSPIMSDINNSLPSVLLDNGFNATSVKFIKALLSNMHDNDTSLHNPQRRISQTIPQFLFEFDGEDVVREKIKRDDDDEEGDEEKDDEDGDEEKDDEDKPTLTSNFPMKQFPLDTSSEDDGPLNLIPDHNWGSEFPLTQMQSKILFEDEEPLNHIPVRQIQPVQKIQTSDIRRNRQQELNPPGNTPNFTPHTLLASPPQRNANPEEEITVLEKLLKFAEDFPNDNNEVASSIQNENDLFEAFNGGHSFFNIQQGDPIDKKSDSGQEKESEEDSDVGRDIENESVVRTDTQTSERSRGQHVSQSNTADLIAALFADDQPEVSVIKFNDNQEVQEKDSDEETANEVQTLFEQTFSNEDDVENTRTLDKGDNDSSEDDKKINIAEARKEEDSASNENNKSSTHVDLDSGVDNASNNDDSGERRPLSESNEKSGETISDENLTNSDSEPGDRDPESTEQSSSKENSFEKFKDSSNGSGESTTDSEMNEVLDRGSDDSDLEGDEQNSSDKKLSTSNEGDSTSVEQDSSGENSESKSVEIDSDIKDKDSSEENKNTASSVESSDSSEEDTLVKLQPEVKTIQDRKPVRKPKKPFLQHNLPHNYQLFNKPKENAPIPPDNRRFPIEEPEAVAPRETHENRDLSEDTLIKLQSEIKTVRHHKPVHPPKQPFQQHNLPDEDIFQPLDKPKVYTPVPPDIGQIYVREPEDPPQEVYENRDFSYLDDDIPGNLNLPQPIRNDNDLIHAISEIENTLPVEIERIKLRNIQTRNRKKERNHKITLNSIYGRNYGRRQIYNRYLGGTDYGRQQGYARYSGGTDYGTQQGYARYSGGTDYGTQQGYKWYSTTGDENDYGAGREYTTYSRDADDYFTDTDDYFTDTDDEIRPIYTLPRHGSDQLLKLTSKELDDLNQVYRATKYRRPTHHYPGVKNGHEEWNSKVRSSLLRGNMGRRRRIYGKRHHRIGPNDRMLTRGRYGAKRRSIFRPMRQYRRGGSSRLLQYLLRTETYHPHTRTHTHVHTRKRDLNGGKWKSTAMLCESYC
ncbi:midasin-like [Ostrea edulis]|uniref:midasin-like n=1 Tax=Ostrea edulis TaxID=37623 RepID=UPI0024AEDD52|nr:midasin-like [Ostrea edulis]